MARPKSVQVNDEVDESVPILSPVQTSDPEEDYTPEDLTILSLLEEYRGDANASVRIYRQGTNYRDLTLLHECSPEEFQPMMLANEPYGGGTFRIHIRGRNGIGGNRQIKVAPAVHLRPREAQEHSSPVLAAIAETNKAILAVLAHLSAPREASNPLATLEGIKAIAEIIKPAQLLTNSPASVPPQDGFSATLKAARELIALTRDLSPAALPTGEDGKPDFGQAALLRGLDIFGKAMETRMNGAAPATVPSISASASGNAIAGPVELPAEANAGTDLAALSDEKENLMMMQIKLRQANRAAARGDDPVEFAEGVADFFGENEIRELQSNPDWFRALCDVLPDCANHPAWYESVRNALIKFAIEDGILTEPAKPDTTATNAVQSTT